MKKLIKLGIIFAIFVVVLNIGMEKRAYAEDLDSITGEANSWLENGEKQFQNIESSGTGITSEITGKLKPIAQALTTIGVGIILCIATYMGIKWLTAKPDEQAKLKQQTVGLLVSAIVVMGAYTIWSIALKIVSQL